MSIRRLSIRRARARLPSQRLPSKRGGKATNFYVYYEVDDDEVPTALDLGDYNGDDDGSWLLLEAV